MSQRNRTAPVAQTSFDETILTDPELSAALDSYDEHGEAARRFSEAKKRIKSILQAENLPAGWYRCGPYRICVKDLAGGDFTIPAWKSKSFAVSGVE